MTDEYRKAQAGDALALGLLVRRHIPLVQALCRRFSQREDVFQQGCVGLVKAIRAFQPETGNAFSTYAVPVILGEMKKTFARDVGWRSRAAVKKAKDYQARFFQQHGHMPGISETAKAAGLPAVDLCLLLEMEQGPQYDETGDLLTSIPDPNGDKWLTRFCVRDVLSRMPREESRLLTQRYFRGRTQTELACAWSVTQYALSRAEKKARARFRAAWTEED